MLELTLDARLSQETSGQLVPALATCDHRLQGDVASDPAIARNAHRTHPTLAQKLGRLVPLGEGRGVDRGDGEAGGEIGHGGLGERSVDHRDRRVEHGYAH